MMTRLSSSLLAMLAMLTMGCTIKSFLNKIDNESEETVDLVCSCSNVFPDRAMCEAQFGSLFDFLDRECVEDALAVDKKASKAFLDCLVDQQKAYNDCLKDKLDCNNPLSFQGCESAFDSECPEPPEAVQIELSACASNL